MVDFHMLRIWFTSDDNCGESVKVLGLIDRLCKIVVNPVGLRQFGKNFFCVLY